MAFVIKMSLPTWCRKWWTWEFGQVMSANMVINNKNEDHKNGSFEINSPETWFQQFNCSYEFIWVLRINLNIYGIDVCKLFEQNCLSLHYRFRSWKIHCLNRLIRFISQNLMRRCCQGQGQRFRWKWQRPDFPDLYIDKIFRDLKNKIKYICDIQ